MYSKIVREVMQMAKVKMIVDPNTSEKESVDSMLRRFKKQVKKEGILQECRRREFFLKKSLARKEKSKRARIARKKK